MVHKYAWVWERELRIISTLLQTDHRNVSSFSVHWFFIFLHIGFETNWNGSHRIEYHAHSPCMYINRVNRNKMNVCNSLLNFISSSSSLSSSTKNERDTNHMASICFFFPLTFTHARTPFAMRFFFDWRSRIALAKKAIAKIQYGRLVKNKQKKRDRIEQKWAALRCHQWWHQTDCGSHSFFRSIEKSQNNPIQS